MRLTEKREDGQYLKTIKSIDNCLNKLGQLEDIEEELGIDLVTLFKALKKGCYVKPWKSIKFSSIQLQFNNDYVIFDINDNDYSPKDYGKTWALTKEELLLAKV